MHMGDKVRANSEAIEQAVFGRFYKKAFDPGNGYVVSATASMPGCVIVQFRDGERMVHRDWLEPADTRKG